VSSSEFVTSLSGHDQLSFRYLLEVWAFPFHSSLQLLLSLLPFSAIRGLPPNNNPYKCCYHFLSYWLGYRVPPSLFTIFTLYTAPWSFSSPHHPAYFYARPPPSSDCRLHISLLPILRRRSVFACASLSHFFRFPFSYPCVLFLPLPYLEFHFSRGPLPTGLFPSPEQGHVRGLSTGSSFVVVSSSCFSPSRFRLRPVTGRSFFL